VDLVSFASSFLALVHAYLFLALLDNMLDSMLAPSPLHMLDGILDRLHHSLLRWLLARMLAMVLVMLVWVLWVMY